MERLRAGPLRPLARGIGIAAGLGRTLLHHRLHVGEQHVARKRGLAGAGDAGDHDEALERNVDVDVVQVVQVGALEAQEAEVIVEARFMVDPDVGVTHVHAGNRYGRRRQVVLDLDAGLHFLERFLPPAAQRRIADIVVATDAQGPGGLVLGHVAGQTR